ncbi:MAG TPA: hypothetical protein DHV93_05920 [Holophagaceae bacterium]|nr:hypothetical protein [Holophagaceae bacterium]
MLLLTCFISSLAMAQGFGITLGLSSAKPQSIQDASMTNQLGAYLGASYRWKEFTFGGAYKTPGKSTISYSGFESKDEFKWSYSEASLQYGIPFKGESVTHRLLLGGAMRFEHTKAEDSTIGLSASSNFNRFWWRAGYEVEGEVEEVFTSLGLFYAGTSRDSFDPNRDYTTKEVHRLFSPTAEFQVVLTFRF